MKPDVDLVMDLVNAARLVQTFTEGMSFDAFLADQKTHFAVYSQFVILGEASRRISQEFRDAHPDVPWREMISMRNRVAHGYDEIDWEVVWSASTSDLPPLVERLERLLPNGSM